MSDEGRWIDNLIPGTPKWARDLIDEELTRRDAKIIELIAGNDGPDFPDGTDAEGFPGGDERMSHTREFVEDEEGYFVFGEAAIRKLTARVDELESRLELTDSKGRSLPQSCDGVACRDETIKQLDKRLTTANARERPAFEAGWRAGWAGRQICDALDRAWTLADLEYDWQKYRCQDDTDWRAVNLNIKNARLPIECEHGWGADESCEQCGRGGSL